MNIGDYVRTKTGIHKIFRINENATSWKYHCDKKPTGEWDSSYEYIKIRAEDIIKSSPNIIDLIEVGDYVNGCLIVEISKDPFIKGQINLWTNMIISEGEPFPNEYYKAKILEKDVKSIITKEQFESMEYKL